MIPKAKLRHCLHQNIVFIIKIDCESGQFPFAFENHHRRKISCRLVHNMRIGLLHHFPPHAADRGRFPLRCNSYVAADDTQRQLKLIKTLPPSALLHFIPSRGNIQHLRASSVRLHLQCQTWLRLEERNQQLHPPPPTPFTFPSSAPIAAPVNDGSDSAQRDWI